MARIFRRAAHKVKNSRDGHGSLGLLIFDEKVVYENFQKVVLAKADGRHVFVLIYSWSSRSYTDCVKFERRRLFFF